MSFGWALCHLKYNWTHSIEEERRASGQLVAVVSEENDRGQRPHLRSLLDDLDTVGFLLQLFVYLSYGVSGIPG